MKTKPKMSVQEAIALRKIVGEIAAIQGDVYESLEEDSVVYKLRFRRKNGGIYIWPINDYIRATWPGRPDQMPYCRAYTVPDKNGGYTFDVPMYVEVRKDWLKRRAKKIVAENPDWRSAELLPEDFYSL